MSIVYSLKLPSHFSPTRRWWMDSETFSIACGRLLHNGSIADGFATRACCKGFSAARTGEPCCAAFAVLANAVNANTDRTIRPAQIKFFILSSLVLLVKRSCLSASWNHLVPTGRNSTYLIIGTLIIFMPSTPLIYFMGNASPSAADTTFNQYPDFQLSKRALSGMVILVEPVLATVIL